MSDVVAKIMIKVYLVSGKEITHIYEVPKSDAELKQFIKDMVERTLVLTRGDTGFLWFDNPNITYNPDNVLGIELTSIGVTELETILKKAQAKIGYVKK